MPGVEMLREGISAASSPQLMRVDACTCTLHACAMRFSSKATKSLCARRVIGRLCNSCWNQQAPSGKRGRKCSQSQAESQSDKKQGLAGAGRGCSVGFSASACMRLERARREAREAVINIHVNNIRYPMSSCLNNPSFRGVLFLEPSRVYETAVGRRKQRDSMAH